MYCTQPAARQFGPADQAESTASGPVVSSLTPASAEMREACHEGQHGLRSGPAPAPLFMTSARQPSSARHAGGEQRVTGIDQVGQLGRPEPQFWSKSANPRLEPAWLSSTSAGPSSSEHDDGRIITAEKRGASRLVGVRDRSTRHACQNLPSGSVRCLSRSSTAAVRQRLKLHVDPEMSVTAAEPIVTI